MNLLKYFRLHCLLIFIMPPICICAQPPKLKFKHITSEQGLSNSTIETIYQDKKGFIWFGTRDGLNRYDGYQMTVYRYDQKDTTSLSDNYIRYIYEDPNETLWVGTINGLNRFDRSKNKFTRYKHNPNSEGSLSNNTVTCIYTDKKGNMWVSTFGGGINLFKPAENTFTHFKNQQGKLRSLASDSVNFFVRGQPG